MDVLSKNIDWNQRLKSIREILSEFTLEDIIKALTTSYLWLPNIASPHKFLYLFAILTSIPPKEFKGQKRLNQYSDFVAFLETIYPLLPSFGMLEDYVPEPDWGEVKFNFQNKNYKIFYGNEVETIVDFLELFKIVHCSIKERYLKHLGLSPIDDLEICLNLQNHFIERVGQVIHQQDAQQIEPGDIEIPSELFWDSVCKYIDGFDPSSILDGAPLSPHHSILIGKNDIFDTSEESFLEQTYLGSVLPYYFIQNNGKYFPLLSRRHSAILLDRWSKRFFDHYEQMAEGEMPYSLRWGKEIYRYIKDRAHSKNLFSFVSAVHSDGKPHKTIFTAACIVEDRIFLINSLGFDFSNDLNDLTKIYEEVAVLLKRKPVTLALNVERKNVEFRPKGGKHSLKPYFITLIPDFNTAGMPSAVPIGNIPGQVLGMRYFLALVDEMKDFEELKDFFEYISSEDRRISMPMVSVLDQFGAYRDSRGVLVAGANEPHKVFLDPHWGSNLRYRSLKRFWSLFPAVGYFDIPGSWRVEKIKESVIRLESRGYFGGLLCLNAHPIYITLTAPFEPMAYEQAQLANFLMECFSDIYLSNKTFFDKFKLFASFQLYHLIFFPISLVKGNPQFQHLQHLDCSDRLWVVDAQMLDDKTVGLRIVFNDELVRKAFLNVKDVSMELNLLFAVMDCMNAMHPDTAYEGIKKDILNASSGKKPHYRLFNAPKSASFPDLVGFLKPDAKDIKLANKRIAQIIKGLKITPQEYDLKEARDVLNAIRVEIVKEINKEVSALDFKSSVVKLIGMIDAVIDHLKSDRIMLKESITLDVEYSRDGNYAKSTEKFTSHHKNYRYLIEKFVQLRPKGRRKLDDDKTRYLLALVDSLHLIYDISDFLHYEIGSPGIVIDDDYVIDLRNTDEMSKRHSEFGKEQARFNLGLKGNAEDEVVSPRKFEDFLNGLNGAFKEDLGFSLRHMLSVCEVLALWPLYQKDIKEAVFYCASLDEIVAVCLASIPGLEANEVNAIVDFLNLKQGEVLRIIGQEDLCDDLPVWEYLKRPNRYILKPLIEIGGKYFWGPHSARKAGDMWTIRISMGAVPVRLEAPRINACVQEEKTLIERELESKTLKILKKMTPYAENVALHKRDRKGKHPEKLGDYDVLAFIESKKLLLNIECKDILPPQCLKDADTVRQKIFGKDGERGYLGKVEDRGKYLEENLEKVFNSMKWPNQEFGNIKVVSVYVSRHIYWWTMYPPVETSVKFIRIDALGQFLQSL